MNATTRGRIDALIARYDHLAASNAEALKQIALAEISEAVYHSNAIEDSTLTLEDTERILGGTTPATPHDIREVFEATIIPLSAWASSAGVRANIAANKAKRQTIPAFRIRDRWMISED